MGVSRLGGNSGRIGGLPWFVLLACMAWPAASMAQEESESAESGADVSELQEYVTTEQVQDDLSVIPTEPVDSIFGTGKTLLETPRAATSISAELLDQYGAEDINDLVKFSPGAYTSSFFGVAGSLDVRGSPADTYFRGMKRIENPGNYPTPIAASDRVDVVRGPSSPIFGPGKVGGYLNFIPKSARAETGRYLDTPAGSVSSTVGSYGKFISTAEVGGPVTIAGNTGGYYVYGMFEDSDSYYNNSFQDQVIIQSTFDFDLSAKTRITFGQQYQRYEGTEIAGWNRITQDLIDNGTYLAGVPLVDLSDGDRMTPASILAGGNLFAFSPCCGNGGELGDQFALDPATVEEVQISGRDVVVDSLDGIKSDSLAVFFDIIVNHSPSLTFKNKVFVDFLNREKMATYAFSQENNALSIEDKFIVEHTADFGWLSANSAFAPAVRYYRAEDKSDSDWEYLDRRDLSRGATPNDRVVTALESSSVNPWNNYHTSYFWNPSVALLTDLTLFDDLDILLGWRWDYIDLEAVENGAVDGDGDGVSDRPITEVGEGGEETIVGYQDAFFQDNLQGSSYNISVSYQLPFGIRPYFTTSEQKTLITNQTGGVSPSVIQTGALDASELVEYGVKGTFFNGRLYVAFADYEQERSSFSTQTLTVLATRGTGQELEIRWVPTDNLSFTGAVTNQETIYDPANPRFVFASPAISGFDPAQQYGGTIGTSLTGDIARERVGVPELVYSLFGNYRWRNWDGSLGVTYYEDTFSGAGKTVKLPEAYLVTAQVGLTLGDWSAKLTVNNALDERYFRSLFPDIFGDVVVLPELPRTVDFRLRYDFG